MAIIWVRPQGSNMEGTRIRSQAAAGVAEGDMMAGHEGCCKSVQTVRAMAIAQISSVSAPHSSCTAKLAHPAGKGH